MKYLDGLFPKKLVPAHGFACAWCLGITLTFTLSHHQAAKMEMARVYSSKKHYAACAAMEPSGKKTARQTKNHAKEQTGEGYEGHEPQMEPN